jgi:alpha-beta hydrolase superfamily lysophospholipase
VENLKLPIIYFTGDKDEIVPYTQTEKLHELSTSAVFKELVIIENGRHNSAGLVGQKEYMYELGAFLDKCMVKYT